MRATTNSCGYIVRYEPGQHCRRLVRHCHCETVAALLYLYLCTAGMQYVLVAYPVHCVWLVSLAGKHDWCWLAWTASGSVSLSCQSHSALLLVIQ